MSRNGFFFTLAVVTLVVLWWLFQRRGRTIERLLLEAQTQVTRNEMRRLREELRNDKTEEKLGHYNNLKSQYGELVAKLGLRLIKTPDKPDAGRNTPDD